MRCRRGLGLIVAGALMLAGCASSGHGTTHAPAATRTASAAAAPGSAALVARLRQGFGAHHSAHVVERSTITSTLDVTLAAGRVSALRLAYTDPSVGAVQEIVVGATAWIDAPGDFCLHGKPWHTFPLEQSVDDPCLEQISEATGALLDELSPAGVVTLVQAATSVTGSGTHYVATVDVSRLPVTYAPKANEFVGVTQVQVTLDLDASGGVTDETLDYTDDSHPVHAEFAFGPYDRPVRITPPAASQVAP